MLPTIHAVATTNVVNPGSRPRPQSLRLGGHHDHRRRADRGAKDRLHVESAGVHPRSDHRDDRAVRRLHQRHRLQQQSPYQVQSPGGITPLGRSRRCPPARYQQRRTERSPSGQEAFNLLNAQFTAGLALAGRERVGEGLGLSSVNLTLGYYGNVGVTATAAAR